MGRLNYLKNMMMYIKKGGFRQGGVQYVRLTQLAAGELLKDKHIIITGGGSGIGFAIARRCAESGAAVLITGRNREKLLEAAEKLGERARFIVHDIRNTDEPRYLEMVRLLEGRVDCLVNNAGISPEAVFGGCGSEGYGEIMDTNLKGPYFISQFFVRHWCEAGQKGNIVNIASNSALVGMTSPYGLSKCAMASLTEGIAKSYHDRGIRCNAVAPDVTVSGITGWSAGFDPEGNLADSHVRHGRVFRPEEIAEVALFLISDASACVNGQLIACDNGGSLAQNTVG